MKSRLNCLLMRDIWTDESEDTAEEVKIPVDDVTQSNDSGNESHEDELWDQLEVVKTKKKKRRPKYEDDNVEDEDSIVKAKKRKAATDEKHKIKEKKVATEKNHIQEVPPADESTNKKKKKSKFFLLFCSDLNPETHCGIVTPFDDRKLGEHCLRLWVFAWRHQTTTWTNLDLSSIMSSDIHLRTFS